MTKMLQRLVCDTRAAVAVPVAIALTAFIGLSAVAIDMGAGYITRTGLQNTADSAALAGASALPNLTTATARARTAASANMDPAKHGDVLLASDVLSGNWNATTRVFTANGSPLNAVRVVTRRATANGNPLPSMFAGVFGRSSFDVVAAAVAVNAGGGIDDCLRNGFLANGQFEVGSNVTITGDTCVHGQHGIMVGSDVEMLGTGVDVTYGVGSNFEGRNNSGNNIPVAVEENKAFPVNINDILNTFLTNPSLAPQPNWGPWNVVNRNSDWKPTAAQCNAANGSRQIFIVTGKVELTECTTLNRFAVYASKEIILPSGSSSPNQFKMQDMYFASNDYIVVGSNVDIGGSNYCNDGLGSSFFIARNRITFQSDIRMWGVQIISGNGGGSPTSPGIELGDDLTTQATAIWSAGYLKLGSNPNLNGNTSSQSCNQSEHVLTHSGTIALRLVD